MVSAWAPVFEDHPPFTTLSGQREFVAYCENHARSLEERRAYERQLAQRDQQVFSVRGYCAVCEQTVEFQVDFLHAYQVDGFLTPNWRERLVCPLCHFNNRARATIHLLRAVLRPSKNSSIYMTERLTPLFEWMSHRFPSIIGSEYFGAGVPLGWTGGQGARNEDITRLTFPDRCFQYVICLDVLEHVPDYQEALIEIRRVLLPGGVLLLSVPFRTELDETEIRARVAADGSIEHLRPPEYHGDPIRTAGCLAFYHYGWDLLNALTEAGFADVTAVVYWSAEYGYLGREQVLLLARCPPGFLRRLPRMIRLLSQKTFKAKRYSSSTRTS